MKFGQENMDALLFDYLEGNLNNVEVIELEKELSINTDLNEELEIWKSATVTGDFYDTSKIEKAILNNLKPGFTIINYLNIFLITSLIFISGIQKESTDFQLPATSEIIHHHSNAENPKVSYLKKENLSPAVSILIDPFKISHTIPTEIQVEKEWVKPGELLHHSIDNIPVKSPPGYAITVKIPSIKTTIVKQKQKTALDRNSIKQLRKHGRKYKYGTEFKSGKVPYVVPLNSQNFY